ncbi:MAG TPA: hypothetical protein VNO33_04890 [Kofleriaceae bacterium]|nr:hypothetical protein [Kofleriaceae bacterium]
MAAQPRIPPVRVVSGVDQPYRLRARLADAARPLGPAAQQVLAFAVGFWPLWMVGLLLFGLMWAFAMNGSP